MIDSMVVASTSSQQSHQRFRKLSLEEGSLLLSFLVSTRNRNTRKCLIDFSWRAAVVHWNRWLISQGRPADGSIEFAQHFFNEQSEVFSRHLSTGRPAKFPYRSIFCEIMDIKYAVIDLYSLSEGIELLKIIKRNINTIDKRRYYLWPKIVVEFRKKMMALGYKHSYVTKAKIRHYFSGNYKRYRTYITTGRPKYFPDEFKKIFGEIFYNIDLPDTNGFMSNKQYLTAQKQKLTLDEQMASETENSDEEVSEGEHEEENRTDSPTLAPRAKSQSVLDTNQYRSRHGSKKPRLRLIPPTLPHSSNQSQHSSTNSKTPQTERQKQHYVTFNPRTRQGKRRQLESLLLSDDRNQSYNYQGDPLYDDEVVLVDETVVPDAADEGITYRYQDGENLNYLDSAVPINVSSTSLESMNNNENNEHEEEVNRYPERSNSGATQIPENPDEHDLAQSSIYQDEILKYPTSDSLLNSNVRPLQEDQQQTNQTHNSRGHSYMVVLKISPSISDKQATIANNQKPLPASATDLSEADQVDHEQIPDNNQPTYSPLTSEYVLDHHRNSVEKLKSSNLEDVDGDINNSSHNNQSNLNVFPLDEYSVTIQRLATPESPPRQAFDQHSPHNDMQVILFSDDENEEGSGSSHPLLEYAKLQESCEAEMHHSDVQNWEQNIVGAYLGEKQGYNLSEDSEPHLGPGMLPGPGIETNDVCTSEIFISVLHEYSPQERFALCSELVYKPYSANLHQTLQLVRQDADLIREVLNLVLFNMNYVGD